MLGRGQEGRSRVAVAGPDDLRDRSPRLGQFDAALDGRESSSIARSTLSSLAGKLNSA